MLECAVEIEMCILFLLFWKDEGSFWKDECTQAFILLVRFCCVDEIQAWFPSGRCSAISARWQLLPVPHGLVLTDDLNEPVHLCRELTFVMLHMGCRWPMRVWGLKLWCLSFWIPLHDHNGIVVFNLSIFGNVSIFSKLKTALKSDVPTEPLFVMWEQTAAVT